MKVPFYDMAYINSRYLEKFNEKLNSIVSTGIILNGPNVKEFEQSFAKINGAVHCVGVASGLDALSLSLKSAGVAPGDEVLVPNFTFVATWLSVINIGATPIPVDVNASGLIDLELAEKKINGKTRAIIPVNLYGQIVSQSELTKIIDKFGIFVVEDCAQSHGMPEIPKSEESQKWIRAYSFYPSKIIGALGDSGAVVSNNTQVMSVVRKLANYGSDKKYQHELLGVNSRMEELHASHLNIKLFDLKENIALRRKVAEVYIREIVNPEISIITDNLESTFHLFVIATDNRQKLMDFLSDHEIETIIHYPYVVSEIPVIKEIFSGKITSDIVWSRKMADSVVSLPIWPNMPGEYISHVVDKLNQFEVKK